MGANVNRIFFYVFILITSSCKEAPAPLPTANFYVEGDACTAPCRIKFWNQSSESIKWRWDFDNGTFSNNEDDSSLYEFPGIYNVKLKAWNIDDVADSVIKTVIVN